MKRLCTAVALVVLGGCTSPQTSTVWSKPDATEEDVAQDSARCRLVARAFSPESVAPYLGSLGPSALGGEVVNLRQERYFGECMLQRGYSPQTAATDTNPGADGAPVGESKELPP